MAKVTHHKIEKHLKKDIREAKDGIKRDKALISSLKKKEPKNMDPYKNYTRKELQEHISAEKKVLRRKK